MSRDYDVIIIGSGPAGFSCAMQSAKLDKRALVVESHEKYLGGTWINTGTVPSKALREAANTILEFTSQFGTEGQKPYEKFKMNDLLQHKNKILEKENRKVKEDFIRNKVDVARGFGTILDAHTVEIETHFGTIQKYTSDYILVCTGCSPEQPENFTVDHDKVRDYKSILKLTHIPRRLVIIGGGINALEYSTIFSSLGTRITILSSDNQLFTFLDDEIREQFQKLLTDKTINVHMGANVDSVEFNPLNTYVEVRFQTNSEPDRVQVVETEHVLFMGGKKPNTSNLGLKKAGIETDKKGYVKVDNTFKTNIDNVYAAGDIIGFPHLASASFTQGRLAACNMFDVPALDVPDRIPYGIYTIPEISHIGLTEKEARNMGMDITVGKAYFKNIAKADMTNHDEGMLKLVFHTRTLKLLGVHIIGDQATNLIHLGQAVMSYDGDIRYFIRHVMNYPTLSEAYRIAAFNGVNKVFQSGVKYQEILENTGDDLM